MKKRYKSIFFDLDNTLWDFDKNSFEALRLTYIKYKLENKAYSFEDFHKIYSQINDNCWKLYREKTITKHQLISKRFQDTFDAFSITGINAIEFNKDYLAVMPNQKLLMEGTVEILDYLKRKNYRLYIITNGFKEVQNKKLAKTNLSKYFQKVFVSEEVKAPKPNREIFEHAFKSTNSAKKDSIMIGDSWESDIIGAMKFGIDQIYFSPYHNNLLMPQKKLSLRNSKISTFRIDKLEQIINIL